MDEQQDQIWDVEQWTPAGADRLRAAAQALAAAVLTHAEAVLAAVPGQEPLPVFEANDGLAPAVLDYLDAQFDLTGIGSPFGYIGDDDDDEPDDEGDGDGTVRYVLTLDGDEVDDEGVVRYELDLDPVLDADEGALLSGRAQSAGISVLQRRDYAVVDRDAVLATGRAAYRSVRPDAGEAESARDVTDLGRALSELAQAGEGFSDLDELPGLAPTGGAVQVLPQSELLLGTPDGWPDALFDVPGEPLYEMRDIYTD